VETVHISQKIPKGRKYDCETKKYEEKKLYL